MKIKKSNQKGVTLLETILVLSLISVMMTGGLSIYKNANYAVKAHESRRQVVALATGVRSIFSNINTYAGVNGASSSADLIKMGIVPVDMASQDKQSLINTFGGEVTVTATSGSGATNSKFEIEFANVSKQVCYKLVTTYLGADFVSNKSGCSAISNTCIDGAMDLNDAGDICNSLSDGKLYFIFG